MTQCRFDPRKECPKTCFFNVGNNTRLQEAIKGTGLTVEEANSILRECAPVEGGVLPDPLTTTMSEPYDWYRCEIMPKQ